MLGEIKLSHIWEIMVESLKPFRGSMHWADLPRAKLGFSGRAHKLQGSPKQHPSSHPFFVHGAGIVPLNSIPIKILVPVQLLQLLSKRALFPSVW